MIKAARYQPVIWLVNKLKVVERSLLGLKGYSMSPKYGHPKDLRGEKY